MKKTATLALITLLGTTLALSWQNLATAQAHLKPAATPEQGVAPQHQRPEFAFSRGGRRCAMPTWTR